MYPSQSNSAWLSIGSNLGDRKQNLETAIEMLNENLLLPVKVSSVYETDAWGFASDHPFLNLCAEINSQFEPREMLEEIKKIENLMGRTGTGEGYNDRIIDIDIIFFGERVLRLPNLIIPHARFAERRFVLVPLNEIAPHKTDPVTGETVTELLEKCPDTTGIQKVSS